MNIFVAVKVLSMMHSGKLYVVRVGKNPKNFVNTKKIYASVSITLMHSHSDNLRNIVVILDC